MLQYSFSIWRLIVFGLQNSILLDYLFPTFQLLFRFKIVRSSTDSMAVSFQSIACILYLNAFDTTDKLFDKDKFLFYFFFKKDQVLFHKGDISAIFPCFENEVFSS